MQSHAYRISHEFRCKVISESFQIAISKDITTQWTIVEMNFVEINRKKRTIKFKLQNNCDNIYWYKI